MTATQEATEVKKVVIVPLGNRLLIKPDIAELKTKSGIILPDQAHEKPQTGVVIAKGEGRYNTKGKRVPIDVEVGEKVLFGKYSMTAITLDDDEDLYFVKETDIHGVLD